MTAPAATLPAVTVATLTRWTLADCAELAERAAALDDVVVPVRCDGRLVLVGPPQYRGAPLCLECAEHARLTAQLGRLADDRIVRDGVVPPALAEMLAVAVRAVAATARHADADRIRVLHTADFGYSTHTAHPRPGCPRCAPCPVDTASTTQAALPSGRSCEPYSLRGENARTSARRLRAELADEFFGPVPESSRSERIALPIARAAVAARMVEQEGGYGRAATYGDAERTALFEAVERISGMGPRGRRTAVTASFAELGPDRALDPTTLGRHEASAETDPRFALAAWSPDLRIDWVFGWSFARSAPVAVPEQAAYWGVPAPRGTGLLAESSNGCGLGNSPEEAALYGLFELIERDAFLMAWFARTPLGRVRIPTRDRLVSSLDGRLDSLGYELLLLDATNDLGVPVAVAVARSRDAHTEAPQAFVAAAAHPDPLRAITGAVVEVVVNVEQAPNVARALPAHFDRARLRPMLDDPAAVTTIEDHVGLNALPEARPRWEPLLAGAAARPWDEVWAPPAPEDDIAAYLHRLRSHLLGRGVDTVVVDQTEPRARDRLGLHAARVIAPGIIPLTFGHLYRRTRGVTRLTEVPARLGRLPAPPRYADLPLDPHPFP